MVSLVEYLYSVGVGNVRIMAVVTEFKEVDWNHGWIRLKVIQTRKTKISVMKILVSQRHKREFMLPMLVQTQPTYTPLSS